MSFEDWIEEIIKRDNNYSHLKDDSFIDERLDFFVYYKMGWSPYMALQEEYRQYG